MADSLTVYIATILYRKANRDVPASETYVSLVSQEDLHRTLMLKYRVNTMQELYAYFRERDMLLNFSVRQENLKTFTLG